ncbi:MAG: hypothetical protein DRP66_04885 [Planctomycetota bacterium]|nr:MAG: hypothetical protein DRP66_04885 [Planctomycetota bacterium]
MKRRAIAVFVSAAMLVAAIGAHVSALGIELRADKYYTWGISSDDVSIAEGSIITEAILTIHGITNWDNNLHMHIVDNPPPDFVANEDNDSGDFFQDFGGLLSGYTYELVNGDLVITFSRINEENSWVWDIFDYPFNFQLADSSDVSYSSSLLELIDYAGNSTPFGIGFDHDSSDDFSFRGISLQLTVKSFEGEPVQSLLTYSYGDINRAPVLESLADQTVAENEELSFVVRAEDPDGDDIEYRARRLPYGAKFENGTFSWRPGYDQAGLYYVLFAARDGLARDLARVLIKVNNTNRPPVLTPIGARVVGENAELSFTINATDPDGDQIEYDAYGLPHDAEFENGTFSWRPGYGQAGLYYVLFVACDGLAMDFASVLIQVY